jgi:alpha-L-rhamnosidase
MIIVLKLNPSDKLKVRKRMQNIMPRLVFVLAMFAICCACGNPVEHPQNSFAGRSVISIEITPNSISLPIGNVASVHVIGTYSDGSMGDVTNIVAWTSSNENVAAVRAQGVIASATVGVTVLTASINNASTLLTCSVTPAILESSIHTPLPEQYMWIEDGRAEHYFRSSFAVDQIPAAATLYIAGPTMATVYINGKQAGSVVKTAGQITLPVVGVFDVTKFLSPGVNIIAIDALGGDRLAAKLVPSIEGENVSPILISGDQWKANSNLIAGWEQPNFDDSQWDTPTLLGGIESDFTQFEDIQDTELYRWPGYDGYSGFLAHKTLIPSAIRDIDPGLGSISLVRTEFLNNELPDFNVVISPEAKKDNDFPQLVFDFGREINGRIAFLVDSVGGAKVDVEYGESIEEAHLQPYIGRKTVTIPQNQLTYGPKSGFRYVVLHFMGPATAIHFKQITVDSVYYPAPWLGSFDSSDELLNRIWMTGAYTAQLVMQDGTWDGIKRDRRRWMGDMFVTYRTISAVSGDQFLEKRTLDSLVPVSGEVNSIPGYSAFWVLGHADYYRNAGDLAYLQANHANLVAILRQMETDFDSQDLFFFGPNAQPFVDWSEDLASDTIESRRATQFLFYKAFTEGAWLLNILGDSSVADEVEAKASAIRNSANQYLLDPSSNTFGLRWQPNAMAVFSGLASSQQADDIWNNILSTPSSKPVTPFNYYFAISAMATLGKRQGALNDIRNYWGGMLGEGATTFYEAYDPSWPKVNFHAYLQVAFTGYEVSLCHGWASGVTPWLTQQVLGITSTGPGYSSVVIRPDLIDLKWANGAVPTPSGLIKVSYLSSPKFSAQFDIPANMIVNLLLPITNGQESVSLNGSQIPSRVVENGTRRSVYIKGPGHYVYSE